MSRTDFSRFAWLAMDPSDGSLWGHLAATRQMVPLSPYLLAQLTACGWRETSEELTAVETANEGNRVIVTMGARDRDDHGGGLWYYAYDSTAADDVGMVRQPAGFATGRYLRLLAGEMLSNRAFGAVGDGATDDTDAMVAWFAALQSRGLVGLWEGLCKVREGELQWLSPPGYHGPGPIIMTTPGAGLVAAGAADAPLLQIKKPTLVGGEASNLRFVQGGFLGALEFFDSTGDAGASNRHGLLISGVSDMTFARVYGAGIKGDVVHFENRLLGGNSDFYHNYNLTFGQVEAFNCHGWAINNPLVGAGTTLNVVQSLRAFRSDPTVPSKGVWGGQQGSGNVIHHISCGVTAGYAVEMLNDSGHTASRSRIGVAEFDAPEYGIRLGRIRGFECGAIRFKIRHHDAGFGSLLTTLQTDGQAWPRVCIDLGPGGTLCDHVTFRDVDLQIDNGAITAGHLGDLINFNGNNNVINTRIWARTVGTDVIADAKLAANPPNAAHTNVVTRNSRPLLVVSQTHDVAAVMQSGAGVGSAVAALAYSAEEADDHGIYDVATYRATVPFRTKARVRACVTLDIASGARVDLRVMRTRSGVDAIVAQTVGYSAGGGKQTFAVDAYAPFNAGDLIWIAGAQNSASDPAAAQPDATSPTPRYGPTNRFEVRFDVR